MEVLRIALNRGENQVVISLAENVIRIKGSGEIRLIQEELIPKAATLSQSSLP
jgi:hypothetical protein